MQRRPNRPVARHSVGDKRVVAQSYALYDLGRAKAPPLVRGKVREATFIGGKFNEPFFQAATTVNEQGKRVYRNGLNFCQFFGVSFEHVDAPGAIFQGGSNGSVYTGLGFWYCKSTAFDFRSRPQTDNASNTINQLIGCRFRHFSKNPSVIVNWPQDFLSCFWEDGTSKAIVGSGNLTIRSSTFERVGDEECVIQWDSGHLKLDSCRLAFCPTPKVFFKLGEKARLTLIDSPLMVNSRRQTKLVAPEDEWKVTRLKTDDLEQLIEEAGRIQKKSADDRDQ